MQSLQVDALNGSSAARDDQRQVQVTFRQKLHMHMYTVAMNMMRLCTTNL
jgi:hypothetical protein